MGFDNPDLDLAAAEEFVAAIDAIVPAHPQIALRKVQITPAATHLVDLVQADDTPGSILILNSALVTAATPPAPNATFAATARVCGRALIAAGAGYAPTLAHRTLIGLYLDSLDIRRRYDTLARVVRGYRTWLDREGLSNREGQLDPMAALEEAFLAVIRDGDSASRTAKALYQVIVSAVYRAG
ncbi:hypothetical protein [Nocardia sp. NBC_00511]|uniref:hypothetical protein n=1 Tax=Nocardia sp. NBC_00511 TaxID=2903591 RepID=UPI002F918DC3